MNMGDLAAKSGKMINSWQHFGTPMMISKAWEKFVVDEFRFRPNITRLIPEFEKYPTKQIAGENLPPARKLNIIYLIHYFYPDKQGGTERFVLNLAKQQIQLGNTVRVITLGKRAKSAYEQKDGKILWTEFFYEGVPVTQIRYERAPRGLYYDTFHLQEPGMMLFAERAIDRYRPDIVHFAYPQPFASFAAVCKQKGIPYIATLTDFNIFCHYATMVRKNAQYCDGSARGTACWKCGTYGVKDPVERFHNAELFLETASAVTVPSEFVANVIGAEFPQLPIHMIPHGISDAFYTAAERAHVKRFAYIGTLSPLKGIGQLIDAFTQLSGDAYTLEIYGGGTQAYLNTLKRSCGKDPRIHFMGSRTAEEMPDVYRNIDCVVIPSLWFETYNYVLREALACGCVVIAARIGAMPEAVSEGSNGYLFEPGDTESLLRALQFAAKFDWEGYAPSVFPSPADEAEQYQFLYQKSRCVNAEEQKLLLE